MIPFFATKRPAEDRLLIDEVLAGGQTLQGPRTAQFERTLAAYAGRKHAIAVGSGTDALFLALRTLDIGPGDEVLVPALSFIASASCVLRSGARPVFVDVNDAYLLDLGAAEAAVTERTRAIIAVQLFGAMLDTRALEELARRHDLVIVEDAAQALGAHDGQGRRCGNVGTFSCCSFDPTKPIAAPGSGGAVLCDDDAHAERLRRLRWHGRDGTGRSIELGYNSQLPELSAALLCGAVAREDMGRERRRAIAAHYDAALGVSGGGSDGHAFSKYVVRCPTARDALRQELELAGIPTRVHYPLALSREPCFAQTDPAPTPAAELATREVLSLPMHAQLSDEEVELVATRLRAASSRLAPPPRGWPPDPAPS